MYFLISEELIERSDLGIYEKMALVVLAKYSNSSQKITREMLVEKMGAGKVEFGSEYTDIAIKKLIKHGLLTIANAEELETLELRDFTSEKEDVQNISESNASRVQKSTDFIDYLDDVEDLEEGTQREEQSEVSADFTQSSYFQRKPQSLSHGKNPDSKRMYSNSERLKRAIEEKALEFSDENKFNVIDLSLQENVIALENKRGVPIEEIKSIFEEVCTNQKAKILYHLAQKDIKWLKEAYHIVRQKRSVDPLENLAEFLQENTQYSYHAQLHLEKKAKEDEIKTQTQAFVPEKEDERARLVSKPVPEREDNEDWVQEISEREKREEIILSDERIPEKVTADKNAGLEFYNGYDLKSIFANLERKFEYEEDLPKFSEDAVEDMTVSEQKYEPKSKSYAEEAMFSAENEQMSAGKINMRATSFKQAKNLYSTYGNANLKKKKEDLKTKK